MPFLGYALIYTLVSNKLVPYKQCFLSRQQQVNQVLLVPIKAPMPQERLKDRVWPPLLLSTHLVREETGDGGGKRSWFSTHGPAFCLQLCTEGSDQKTVQLKQGTMYMIKV